MIDIPFETARLVIRRFEKGDLPLFLRFMLDPGSTRYLAFDEARKTREGAKALFDQILSAYGTDHPVHSYAIADRETDRYLGSCGFSGYDRGVAECYFCVNEEHGGKGVASEALGVLASRLAEECEVRAYCHPDNKAAHAVLLKCGFQPAGMSTHRHFGFDGMLFSCPRRTWPKTFSRRTGSGRPCGPTTAADWRRVRLSSRE